jgi:serine/threonine-protein kinase RsbW
VRFRMASRRDAVAPAVERIVAATAAAGLSDEQRDNLAVAVAEALSNAAVHGNGLGSSKMVRVIVSVDEGRCAIVEVTDFGPGFDQHGVRDPTHPERVLVPGGRGVFLMRRLVDRLEYNPSGNSVRLVMEAASASSAGAGDATRR